MGQEYTCIVTKNKIKLSDNVPHFTNNGVITIPVNVNGLGVEDFIENYAHDMFTNPTYNTDSINIGCKELSKEDRFYRTQENDTPLPIIKLLKEAGLTDKQYLVLHTSDWADIPVDFFIAAFTNKNIIRESVFLNGNEMGMPANQAYASIEVEEGSVEYFHNYWDALDAYESK